MKITTISFQGKYSINSQFLDTTLQAEAVLEEGEALEEAMDELKRRMDAKANSYRNPQLVQDAGLNYDFSAYGKHKENEAVNKFANPGIFNPQPQIPERNLKDEEKEKAIDNANNLEELAAIKSTGIPLQLMSHYVKRVRELTPGLKTTNQ